MGVGAARHDIQPARDQGGGQRRLSHGRTAQRLEGRQVRTFKHPYPSQGLRHHRPDELHGMPWR